MIAALLIINWLSGLVVLAEALNKLERTDLFAGRRGLRKITCLVWLLVPWEWRAEHCVKVLKLCGWVLLSIAGIRALATPLLHLPPPQIQGVAAIAGFALLILRSRMKESDL